MLQLFYKPAPILEESGPGWFAPARPRPYAKRPPPLELALAAKRSLISPWQANDYTSTYGSIRLFGRQVFLANSPETVKYVMATRHDNYERKSPQMRRALEYLLGDGLFISDGETWKRRRPLVSDIVHKNRVPTFGLTMEAVTLAMVERWRARPAGEPFNALTEMAELTAEIISRAVFGNHLGAGAAHQVVEAFTRYQGLIDNFNFGYFLGADEGLPVFRGPRLRRAVAQLDRVIDKVVSDHLAGHGEHNSMVDLLVKRQQKSPELGLDLSALRNEAATIFMAGHETTAAVLTWAWYLVANAPWVEEAVLAEIDRVCGGRTPTVADVPKLDWCRSVIEETLRLYPPVPILARQAKEADRIGGIDIDPAALVVVAPWLLHRAVELWEHPERFRPERFLSERPAPYTYIPFAIGPRICAGLAFGLTESILCFAILIQQFRVRVVPGTKVEPASRLTLRPAGGLPVTAQPRG
ncbi:cytochrome P450 [Azorhizobium doebereinerae]|uniref:cytochrome P450 n=1 Tax=Azorhizobium doebereinerae TaxID=281091 RepID=UPI00041DAB1A|nr:cytochrome P450 [Azorhizobium doebereinerae]